MKTEFDINDAVYIPARVREITITTEGVIYTMQTETEHEKIMVVKDHEIFKTPRNHNHTVEVLKEIQMRIAEKRNETGSVKFPPSWEIELAKIVDEVIDETIKTEQEVRSAHDARLERNGEDTRPHNGASVGY